jgi:quinoprotein glucose dehydrogenase
VAARFGLKQAAPILFEMATATKRRSETRVEALRALAVLKDDRLEKATRAALDDRDARVRTEGRRLLSRSHPDEALASLARALESGEVLERQDALVILGDMKTAAADALLAKALDQLLAGKLPPEVHLDLLEAASKRSARPLKEKLDRFEAARPRNESLAAYREALFGGDAERGRQIFLTRTEVACLRCHKVDGRGGEIGPDLTGIATRQKRDYLLESLVEPSKQIAQGFETVVLELTNGTLVSGIVKEDNAKEVKLMTAEGKLVTVPRKQVEERSRGKSAMPEDVMKYLSKRELRDLVEFLAGLK